MDHHRDLRRDLNEGRHAISTPIFMLKGDMPWVLGIEGLSTHCGKIFKKIFELNFLPMIIIILLSPICIPIYAIQYFFTQFLAFEKLSKNSHSVT